MQKRACGHTLPMSGTNTHMGCGPWKTVIVQGVAFLKNTRTFSPQEHHWGGRSMPWKFMFSIHSFITNTIIFWWWVSTSQVRQRLWRWDGNKHWMWGSSRVKLTPDCSLMNPTCGSFHPSTLVAYRRDSECGWLSFFFSSLFHYISFACTTVTSHWSRCVMIVTINTGSNGNNNRKGSRPSSFGARNASNKKANGCRDDCWLISTAHLGSQVVR